MAVISIPRIHRLSDTVINQIAAGEIIERPVSVVKELLENSLDAGARHLVIELRDGGTRLIRVVDDGHGIHADDLQLAIDRHTTSKLSRAEELVRIGTLGFRGEALSTIAAVAKLKLTSRQEGAAHGWMISAAKTGGAPEIKPAAHPVGTTVEVRDLFYNTPARRKFLRSDQTEFIHIQELAKRIALSRSGLALRLIHNERQVLHVSGTMIDPGERMQAVLGKHFAGHCVQLRQRSGAYALSGWLGSPETARSQSDQQYFYLNGRSIRDKLINHAVRLGCQDRMHPGRHPAYLLYLEMDAGLADINVHPAKHEARFRHPRDVHDFVYSAVVNALADATSATDRNSVTPVRIPENISMAVRSVPGTGETAAVYRVSDKQSVDVTQTGRDGTRALALLHGRFIIAEDREGMVLVDSLRAREMVAEVRLNAAYAGGKVRSRPVLVPLVLTVTDAEIKLIERQQPLLARLGLALRSSGPSEVMVCELPSLLPQADALALVGDIIKVLKKGDKEDTLAWGLLAQLARHANDCAAPDQSLREMQALLSEFFALRSQFSVQSFNTAYRAFKRKDLQDLLDAQG